MNLYLVRDDSQSTYILNRMLEGDKTDAKIMAVIAYGSYAIGFKPTTTLAMWGFTVEQIWDVLTEDKWP